MRNLEAQRTGARNRPMRKADFDFMVKIGKGGMGSIIKVRHIPTNRFFAMKVQKGAVLVQKEQLERVWTELKILQMLDHPYVVRLHYSFVEANQIFMCLDFCEGGDLFNHLKRVPGRRLPLATAALYIGEITLALQYLHKRDVIHRDLKPENILIAADGHLKLTDFGLSKTDVSSVFGLDDNDGTRAASAVGTRVY